MEEEDDELRRDIEPLELRSDELELGRETVGFEADGRRTEAEGGLPLLEGFETLGRDGGDGELTRPGGGLVRLGGDGAVTRLGAEGELTRPEGGLVRLAADGAITRLEGGLEARGGAADGD